MQNAMLALVPVIGLLLPLKAPAQGTLYVSNLEQTPTGSAAIGSDSWIAQTFFIVTSNPNTYTLDSIRLLMNPATGSPNDFAVSIYSAPFGTGSPQNNLGGLSGSANPSAGGIYTYTASGITLSSGVEYSVVVTAASPVAQGFYNWSAENSGAANGTWVINNVYYASLDGSSWSFHARQEVFQMAIYATLVPEPGTLALAGLGLACLGFWRCKKNEV